NLVPVVAYPLDGLGQRFTVRIDERDVMEPGVSRWWRALLAGPGVQPDVVMVVVTRQKDGLQADGGTVGGDGKAQHIPVEGGRAIQVTYPEVNVADTDGWTIRGGAACWCGHANTPSCLGVLTRGERDPTGRRGVHLLY